MPPKLGQIPSDNLINNTCKANKSRIKTDIEYLKNWPSATHVTFYNGHTVVVTLDNIESIISYMKVLLPCCTLYFLKCPIFSFEPDDGKICNPISQVLQQSAFLSSCLGYQRKAAFFSRQIARLCLQQGNRLAAISAMQVLTMSTEAYHVQSRSSVSDHSLHNVSS